MRRRALVCQRMGARLVFASGCRAGRGALVGHAASGAQQQRQLRRLLRPHRAGRVKGVRACALAARGLTLRARHRVGAGILRVVPESYQIHRPAQVTALLHARALIVGCLLLHSRGAGHSCALLCCVVRCCRIELHLRGHCRRLRRAPCSMAVSEPCHAVALWRCGLEAGLTAVVIA
eukprot:6189123-Pleurochrysis_carterae.AAC.3